MDPAQITEDGQPLLAKDEPQKDFDEPDKVYLGDSLKAYLNEVSKTPLLTSEQEIDLFRKAEASNKKARDHIIEANLRLVISVAKKFRWSGLPLLDLIQHGNLGLIRSTDRFDWRLGFKFSTYAVWWIQQAVKRAVETESRLIRLPNHAHNLSNKIRSMEVKLGRTPTVEEIRKELPNHSADMIREVIRFRQTSEATVSLDAPTGEDGDLTMDFMVSDPFVDIEADADRSEIQRRVNEALSLLSENERRVIEMRFALGTFNHGGDPMTREEAAAICGTDRLTIRNLEKKALRKLKQMPVLAELLEGHEGHEATGEAHYEVEDEALPMQKPRPISTPAPVSISATKPAAASNSDRRVWSRTCAHCREPFEARASFAILCSDCRGK